MSISPGSTWESGSRTYVQRANPPNTSGRLRHTRVSAAASGANGTLVAGYFGFLTLLVLAWFNPSLAFHLYLENCVSTVFKSHLTVAGATVQNRSTDVIGHEDLKWRIDARGVRKRPFLAWGSLLIFSLGAKIVVVTVRIHAFFP